MTSLAPNQHAFLKLLMEREALRFGDFTLKSGRKSPYFVNTGMLCTGGDLQILGKAYAELIADKFGPEIDCIFGPAYKGIPLALAAAQYYEQLVGRPVAWAYDRKEAKTHGDGGQFVGAKLDGHKKIVVVDDVLTAGTALRESLIKLGDMDILIAGAVVAVDRQEAGPDGSMSAREAIAKDHQLPVAPLIRISDAVEALRAPGIDGVQALSPEQAEQILAHINGNIQD